jgi:hypothetical protein
MKKWMCLAAGMLCIAVLLTACAKNQNSMSSEISAGKETSQNESAIRTDAASNTSESVKAQDTTPSSSNQSGSTAVQSQKTDEGQEQQADNSSETEAPASGTISSVTESKETPASPTTESEAQNQTTGPTVTEPPKPASSSQTVPPTSSAPTESSQPQISKTAYDYEFDIEQIKADCVAIGKSMGYTLDSSLTPSNASWWNPVTASKTNQGDRLKSELSKYVRFHTSENLASFGVTSIKEFNIYAEKGSDGSYVIYFLF